MKKILSLIAFLSIANAVVAQRNVTNANDSNTPLHLLKPDYPVPYGIPTKESVKNNLDKIKTYLEQATPYELVDETGNTITDYAKINEKTVLKKGDFRIISYEWGVTYSAMMQAAKLTGDVTFKNYAENRIKFIADAAPMFSKNASQGLDWADKGPFRGLLNPHALDDCGAMCAAMIKAKMDGSTANVQPLIEKHIDYILTKEHRLHDGTLARNRPQPNTLWLDDMFMGIPALAQMGKLTGEKRYFDEATRQIFLFADKMFNKERGVFMHGWVQSMEEHPQFHWARANGWGLLTMVEVLDVLPENHPDRAKLMELFKTHVKGLQQYQSGSGFWHQLLNKEDSYLETSATAIYAYCMAHGINKGWIDKYAYSPAVLLAWNAITTKINEKGQVEGTCVGTGMAFDPAFYHHRPISPYAAHGYGPVIFAGAEVYELLNKNAFEINDSSVQLVKKK